MGELWRCENCWETCEPDDDYCRNCGASREGAPDASPAKSEDVPAPEIDTPSSPNDSDETKSIIEQSEPAPKAVQENIGFPDTRTILKFILLGLVATASYTFAKSYPNVLVGSSDIPFNPTSKGRAAVLKMLQSLDRGSSALRDTEVANVLALADETVPWLVALLPRRSIDEFVVPGIEGGPRRDEFVVPGNKSDSAGTAFDKWLDGQTGLGGGTSEAILAAHVLAEIGPDAALAQERLAQALLEHDADGVFMKDFADLDGIVQPDSDGCSESDPNREPIPHRGPPK